MKCLKITLVLFSIFILISCTATPNVHVKGENTQMNITQSAPVVAKIALSRDGRNERRGKSLGHFPGRNDRQVYS